METTDYLIWGIVVHLVADWIFQNDWMARNKSSIHHPAAWVHGGIHLGFLCLVFPPLVAALIAGVHMWIDTRQPIEWWQDFYNQTTEGDWAMPVAIWLDQVVHIVTIAIAALLV